MNGPYTPWGYPMPPSYGPTFPPSSGVVYVPMPVDKPSTKSTMDMIQEAENAELAWKAIKKRLKEEDKKDDDKDKKKKGEVNLKGVIEIFGLLSLLSFPMIWLQSHLLQWASSMLSVH